LWAGHHREGMQGGQLQQQCMLQQQMRLQEAEQQRQK
jgi:hypothetical protein